MSRSTRNLPTWRLRRVDVERLALSGRSTLKLSSSSPDGSHRSRFYLSTRASMSGPLVTELTAELLDCRAPRGRANLEHLGGFKIPYNPKTQAPFLTQNKGRFPCPKCTSTFNRKNNLYSHLKFECGQLPRFGCPYCDYASKKSSNIRAHVRRKHYGYKVCVIDVSQSPFNVPLEDLGARKLERAF
ncbi:hypothetical protein KM043_007642 [Ampulex compressa]|nr:hypothetical protein KM043_007642 [Ampulex compressa]